MQLKQFYNIATKVSSIKSAATFGDLHDCLHENDFALFFLCDSTSHKWIPITYRISNAGLWFFSQFKQLLNKQ